MKRTFKPRPLPLSRMALAAVSSCICLAVLTPPAAAWRQSRAVAGSDELGRVLRGARAQRLIYMEAFKNLTADERKVTEIFDERGAVKKRRELVASFLVYQSPKADEALMEFHVTREVDGRALTDYVGRVEELFARVAKAGTWRDEWKRIHGENTRHRLRYERWGVTLYAASQIEEEAAREFDYATERGEKIDGRETVVLSYRRRALDAGDLSARDRKYVGDRGRLWLDAATLQILRWENETYRTHNPSGKNFVYLRDEVSYARSPLGLTVPSRIVTEFYDRVSYNPRRDPEPRAALGGRITFTYDSFRRFDVTSREQLDPVR